MIAVSVTILLKGSPKHLQEVLSSAALFNEVLIYNNGASEDSLEICYRHSNVRVMQGPFLGFGPTHNRASEAAKYDWILSVDSDEVISPELVEEIERTELKRGSVFTVPRHNEFNGKWIKWCGWYPDRVVRLYNRNDTTFSEALVHEGVITEKQQVIPLKGALKHYSYDTIADFLTKMQSYSDLFAKQYAGKKKSSPITAVLHAKAAFFKSYILKRGFLGGYEGFLISIYNAHTAFYKYLKLYEFNKRLPKNRGS